MGPWRFVTGGQWLERLVRHAMEQKCALFVMEKDIMATIHAETVMEPVDAKNAEERVSSWKRVDSC
jgi:hypothetical protein